MLRTQLCLGAALCHFVKHKHNLYIVHFASVQPQELPPEWPYGQVDGYVGCGAQRAYRPPGLEWAVAEAIVDWRRTEAKVRQPA